MKKIVWLGLLVIGIVMIVFGVQGMNSLESDVNRFFRGTPTDKSVWMLVGGILCAIAGGYGVWKGKG
jgi:hypothetical protein